MYWQEETEAVEAERPAEGVVDVLFALDGRTLPVDHAYALHAALLAALPWLADEPEAGIHNIHVAASQNGWFRPEDTEGAVLHISRRTRMTLRLPRGRLRDLAALAGQTLDIEGHPIGVGEARVRELVPLPTLIARQVVADRAQPEESFVEQSAAALRRIGIRPRKLLCGRSHELRTPSGSLFTRSLMVADLNREESLALQRHGLGGERKLGCGLFVPHKGIAPVRKAGPDD